MANAGLRSPLLPLGISATAVTGNPGYTSLCALWTGGASVKPKSPGYRDLCALWMGGASAGKAAPQPPTSGGGGYRYDVRDKGRPEAYPDDDQEVLMLLAIILPTIL